MILAKFVPLEGAIIFIFKGRDRWREEEKAIFVLKSENKQKKDVSMIS